MNDLENLQNALQNLAGISEKDFELSRAYWQPRQFKKGEFYNEYKNVCKYLGFIYDGVFRTYYIDEKSGEEKNVFFFSSGQVLVAYKSFLLQTPCNYYTQSMHDASIVYIHIDHLQELYKQSHAWEHFGRVLAETAYGIAMDRAESFISRSPEQRYLDLVQQHPDIFNAVPLYHISSYLGIQGPSLSRIRKRLSGK